MSVEKQLDAAQKFLRGIRSLSSYEEIREKQALGVQKALEKVPAYTAAQAAAVLGLLQPDLWSTSHVDAFQEKVALKTKPVETDQQRGLAQDFSLLPHYLSDDLAAAIGDPNADAERLLFRLCHHAAQLTLRNASEATKATLIVMAHWSPCKRGDLAPKQQFDLFCRHKPKVTKYLIAQADGKCLVELPPSWKDMEAEMLKRVFPTGRPADMGEVAKEICDFVRRMPLRKDNRLLQEAGVGTTVMPAAGFPSGTLAVDDVCKVVAACSQSLQVQLSRGQSNQSSGSGDRVAASSSLLAICDGAAEEPSKAVAPEPDLRGPETMSIAEQLAALRGDMERKDGKDLERDVEKQKHLKRPASAKKLAAAPKPKGRPRAKPKAKSAARKPRQDVMKRPAAATTRRSTMSKGCAQDAQIARGTSTGSPSTGAVSRAERRKNVLALVPKKLRAQFSGGCAKCRFTSGCTPSCWFQRGFAV